MEPSEDDSDSEFVGSYELRDTIGSGNCCTVKRAIHVDSGQNVAIKIIDKEKFQGDQYKNVVDLNQVKLTFLFFHFCYFTHLFLN